MTFRDQVLWDMDYTCPVCHDSDTAVPLGYSSMDNREWDEEVLCESCCTCSESDFDEDCEAHWTIYRGYDIDGTDRDVYDDHGCFLSDDGWVPFDVDLSEEFYDALDVAVAVIDDLELGDRVWGNWDSRQTGRGSWS